MLAQIEGMESRMGLLVVGGGTILLLSSSTETGDSLW